MDRFPTLFGLPMTFGQVAVSATLAMSVGAVEVKGCRVRKVALPGTLPAQAAIGVEIARILHYRASPLADERTRRVIDTLGKSVGAHQLETVRVALLKLNL